MIPMHLLKGYDEVKSRSKGRKMLRELILIDIKWLVLLVFCQQNGLRSYFRTLKDVSLKLVGGGKGRDGMQLLTSKGFCCKVISLYPGIYDSHFEKEGIIWTQLLRLLIGISRLALRTVNFAGTTCLIWWCLK